MTRAAKPNSKARRIGTPYLAKGEIRYHAIFSAALMYVDKFLPTVSSHEVEVVALGLFTVLLLISAMAVLLRSGRVSRKQRSRSVSV